MQYLNTLKLSLLFSGFRKLKRNTLDDQYFSWQKLALNCAREDEKSSSNHQELQKLATDANSQAQHHLLSQGGGSCYPTHNVQRG